MKIEVLENFAVCRWAIIDRLKCNVCNIDCVSELRLKEGRCISGSNENHLCAIIQSLLSSANVHLDPPNVLTRTNQMIPYLMFWKI